MSLLKVNRSTLKGRKSQHSSIPLDKGQVVNLDISSTVSCAVLWLLHYGTLAEAVGDLGFKLTILSSRCALLLRACIARDHKSSFAARLADLTSSLAIYSIQELFFRRSFDLAPDLKSW